MTEPILRCHEVILRRCLSITGDELVEHVIIGISEESGAHIGVSGQHMLHAVVLFLTTSQFMTLDDAFVIIVRRGSHHDTILRLARLDRLSIEIVVLITVLLEPPVVDKLLKLSLCHLIHARIIESDVSGEVDLRHVDVVEAHLITAGSLTRLLRGEHIVRIALYLLNEVLRWAKTSKWFHCGHILMLSVEC